MGLVGGALGTRVLKMISPTGAGGLADGTPKVYQGRSKLEVLLGPGVWDAIRGKTVVDFGCGPGQEAVELAERGAKRVIGLDLRERWLEMGRALARDHGVDDRLRVQAGVRRH
jgi:2-polyprenyl-3-methyl-5-hydroxy-6-metoxy-1,4-benzoquinol methylase